MHILAFCSLRRLCKENLIDYEKFILNSGTQFDSTVSYWNVNFSFQLFVYYYICTCGSMPWSVSFLLFLFISSPFFLFLALLMDSLSLLYLCPVLPLKKRQQKTIYISCCNIQIFSVKDWRSINYIRNACQEEFNIPESIQ